MKTETAELLDYNGNIDPIEGKEEDNEASLTDTENDEDTENEDDLHEIQASDDLHEPDAEDTDLDPTYIPDADIEDAELIDDDE